MANKNDKVSLTAPNGMVIKTTSKDSERWVNHFFKVGEKAREKREANESARNQRYYNNFNRPEKKEELEVVVELESPEVLAAQ